MYNILHLIETSGPGGAENVLVSLAVSQKQLGHTVHVCLRKKGWLYDRLIEHQINVFIVPMDGYVNVIWLRVLGQFIQQNSINVLHCHEFTMIFYGSLLAKKKRLSVIATFHGVKFYADRWYRRLMVRLASKRSTFVAVSRDTGRVLCERVGVKADRVVLIENAIDLQKYGGKSSKNQLKAEFGLNEKTKIVGAIGSLYDVKGHIFLVRAAKLVLEKYPQVLFVIAGRGYLQEALTSEIESLEIADQFKLLGFCENIPEVLADLDIFAMPSISEGLPLTLLEAMASSLPVVVTKVGGMPEVIKDRLNGFIVDPKDEDGLAEKIMILLGDVERGVAMGKRNRESVKEKYSLDVMVSRYISLYDRCLK